VTVRIADYKSTEPFNFISRPKGYWIPPSCVEVIERLKLHGIKMITHAAAEVRTVEMYRIKDFTFGDDNKMVQPFEGHMQVSGTTTSESRKQLFPAGSVFVPVDQPLGDLAILLLEPASPDSYFSWGFFHSIFQRTEYMEEYVLEPMAEKMLEDSPQLRKEFEDKKSGDSAFANNPSAILTWFYSKSPYYDERYLLYPIGRAL
jgi:hypothetical protein